jgi:hypothetical protein
VQAAGEGCRGGGHGRIVRVWAVHARGCIPQSWWRASSRHSSSSGRGSRPSWRGGWACGRSGCARRSSTCSRREAWPLERESDLPHTYWSVPADWFPGGVLVQSAQVPELLRVLKRAPRGKLRDAWLRRLARAASAGPDETEYVMREVSELEDKHLPVLDEAIQRGLAVHVTYFSANRGHVDERHITPHRILSGPPARVAATCHINGELRWFRVDRLQRAELDESTPARATDAEAVDRFVVHSIDGYAEGTQPVSCAFGCVTQTRAG